MTLANKSLVDPGLTDLLRTFKLELFRTMNCVKIGTIQSFDGAKKTAKVQIVFKRVLPNGTTASYPLLVDVPVFTLQGGGGAIQFPIAAGDQCILLFSDRNIDAWFSTGSEGAPINARAHDISDGIALVGLNALTSSLAAYEANKLKIFYGNAGIEISGGNVTITGTNFSFAGSGASIEFAAQIITLSNDTTTLLTLLDAFIDVIAAISTVPGGGPLNAPSIAALQAFKLQFATLLG